MTFNEILDEYDGGNAEKVFHLFKKELERRENEFIEILKMLAKSNQNLSESNNNFSMANLHLADSNDRILYLIEEHIESGSGQKRKK